MSSLDRGVRRLGAVSVHDGASASEQAELVANLPAEPFEGMDAALLRIIARVVPLEQTDPEETYAQYHLVETCAKRVHADAAHHPDLPAMLARTIAAFQRERHERPDTPAAKKIAKELEALRKGGVQRIYVGNVTTGDHQLEVLVDGNEGGADFSRTEKFTFNKEVKPKLVGLTLAGPGSGNTPIALGNW